MTMRGANYNLYGSGYGSLECLKKDVGQSEITCKCIFYRPEWPRTGNLQV